MSISKGSKLVKHIVMRMKEMSVATVREIPGDSSLCGGFFNTHVCVLTGGLGNRSDQCCGAVALCQAG